MSTTQWSDRLIHNAGRATFSREIFKAVNIQLVSCRDRMKILYFIKLNTRKLEQNVDSPHQSSYLHSQFFKTDTLKMCKIHGDKII